MWEYHVYTDTTKFINLGYWKNANSLDEAGKELARFVFCWSLLGRLVAQVGEMNFGDDVLDCGFGFGDQDFFWFDEFQPSSITGVNIMTDQVNFARQKALRLRVDDRVKFMYCSATELDLEFKEPKFDLVIALESAFHFYKREDFFKAAFKVLRPGGRIVLADLVPGKPLEKMNFFEKALELFKLSLWCNPIENEYVADVYQKKMEDIGFAQVKISDISDEVLEPLRNFGRSRLTDPVFLQRFNFFHRNRLVQEAAFSVISHGPPFPTRHYIIAQAKKPNEN